MPESVLNIKGCVKKINPTDKVLEDPIYCCQVCGTIYELTSDHPYYVCPVCGYTAEKEAPETCPVCGAKGKMFKKVD